MRTFRRIGMISVAILLVSLPAWAVDVFINGQKVTGATDLSLRNAAVRIDAQGNVHIDAPGYRVKALPGPRAKVPAVRPLGPGPAAATSTPLPQPQLGNTYFLITESNAPGQVQYDADVLVNGQNVRHLEESEGQVIMNITEHLRPGQNVIQIQAVKNLAGGRRSTSNGHVLRILIGVGRVGRAGHVTLTNPLVVFVVDASQTAPVSRRFQLQAR